MVYKLTSHHGVSSLSWPSVAKVAPQQGGAWTTTLRHLPGSWTPYLAKWTTPSLRYLLLSLQDTSRSWVPPFTGYFSPVSFTHYPTPSRLPGIGGPRALSCSLSTPSQESSSHWVSILLTCWLTAKLISPAQCFYLILHPCSQLLMGHAPWMSGEHLQQRASFPPQISPVLVHEHSIRVWALTFGLILDSSLPHAIHEHQWANPAGPPSKYT